MVQAVGSWGVASFENDIAAGWFYAVEEAPDPGAVMAAAIDDLVSAADDIEVDLCCKAIAAAELCASCAGQFAARLPDHVVVWAQTHPHEPHADEIALAVQAVTRAREESGLRDLWDETGGGPHWLAEVDDLLLRLGQSSAGSPPALSP